MHIEPRLLVFTKGVRWRIAGAVGIGLLAVGLGIARLGLLGWLIGQVFLGRPISELVPSVLLIALVMVLRGLAEHWRAVVAHGTAAMVQKKLRRILYDQVASLGPGTVGRQRSGGLTLSMIDGVEQLETYFGQFLPQFMIALLSPILIFAVVAFVDLPVATVMVGFALFALLAPALWHKWDVKNSRRRQTAYASFAAEFLDSIQGLATLKAFGQGKTRADKLEVEARDLFRRTMWVLGTNSLARGITDASIAGGAATALIYGAMRVEAGAMSLSALLIILMLGIEIFRPMRELRSVLHQGMVGLSAAQGIYRILDDKPAVADAAPAKLDKALAPTIEFEDVRFAYPGTRRTVHDSLSFRAAAGERLGLVGPSGGGKSSIVRLLLRFYDPDHGRILLGGHDLRTLPFAEIRSLISVVNQDTFLFHGTVEENIRLGRPQATQQELEDAARAANIHDFILSLPQGYATVIGEKGIKLSGGQRQRVAIARALLARHADPGARRGALSRRRRERGGDPGGARPADAGPHHADPGPSPVERDRLRPHPRARRRQGRRAGPPRRADGQGRSLCRPDGRAGARAADARRARDDRGASEGGIGFRHAGRRGEDRHRRHHQGRRPHLVPGGGRADEGDPAVEGQAHRHLHAGRAARHRLHRRRRPVGADRAGAQEPSALHGLRHRARHRGAACRASCTGSNPGWPTTWPSACWPRCASTPSASSMRWRRPIWCAGAPAI